MGKDGKNAERITTTISKELSARLDHLAKESGVAKAWLVRHAVEQFFRDHVDRGQLRLPLGGSS